MNSAMYTTWRRSMAIYTRTGDKGTSALYTGQRKGKDHPIFQALGSVDTLNASLGMVRSQCHDERLLNLNSQLEAIQCHLMDVGSAIATPRSGTDTATASSSKLLRTEFQSSHITQLEQWIDTMDQTLPRLKTFILPSGHVISTHLHLSRAFCRNAERDCVSLYTQGQIDVAVYTYLNRLSDMLFTQARFVNHVLDEKETIYRKMI